MELVFTTQHHPPAKRFEAWREGMCERYARADVIESSSVDAESTFSRCVAYVKEARFGAVNLSEACAPAQRVERNASHLARLDKDCYYIGIALSGRIDLEQDGASASLSHIAGKAALFSAGAPCVLQSNQTARVMFIEIPRVDFLSRLDRPLAGLTAKFDTRRGIGRIVESMCKSMATEYNATSQCVRENLGTELLNLLALAFTPSEHDPAQSELEASVQSVRLREVQAYIEANLGNPLLSPERIAGAQQMSLRALHYLFKNAGMSVTDFVWFRRLDRCHRDLQRPSHSAHSITDIALAAGFNSLSHFSSAFRKRFGMTPSEARSLAQP